ncbi:MAG: DUF721 domain-containing protein [Aquincola sp.]|uniref:hypothetical protein n=1 Tax=uncultured Aquincola sp. TaxID=886556 RepID=UPI0032B20C6D|nr:DUF721 domain-containing protein [Aquincola sp.]|tara:strand:+ start:1906 stop:2226 length:321 start_codon:yes stop_codon:yes gene_type:complete
MARTPPGGTPLTRPIREALEGSAPLARLVERVQASNQRYRVIEPALPPALRRHIKPGPVDEEGWALLVSNAAVSAKLRQMLPRLVELLQEANLPTPAIRIRVMSGQ